MISRPLRTQIVLIFMGLILVAMLLLMALGRPLRDQNSIDKNFHNALKEIKKAFHLCTSKIMMICFVPFIFCGKWNCDQLSPSEGIVDTASQILIELIIYVQGLSQPKGFTMVGELILEKIIFYK